MTHRRWFLSSTGIVAAMAATASPAIAHEKWFYEASDPSLRWDLLFRPLPLAFLGAVLLLTLAAGCCGSSCPWPTSPVWRCGDVR